MKWPIVVGAGTFKSRDNNDSLRIDIKHLAAADEDCELYGSV